jgi:hypothetical protein
MHTKAVIFAQTSLVGDIKNWIGGGLHLGSGKTIDAQSIVLRLLMPPA